MAGNHVIRWPLNMAQVAVSDGNLQGLRTGLSSGSNQNFVG